MEQKALERAKTWVNNSYFDQAARKEIQDLIDKNDLKEITDRFYRDMEFGTGGIRGVLAMGTNRMNIYNVQKATQALAQYIKTIGASNPKVAISYDSRHFSFEFAQTTASVLAGNGITALIYKRLNPVCLLSFSVRYHQAIAGVMITASHNPPEYNGYKVYWSDGAQVIPPHDQNIINNYNSITDFSSIPSIPFEDGLKKGIIKWVGEDVENEYLAIIKKKAINPELCHDRGRELSLVYTPIHGTGLIPCTKALENLGLTNYHVVEEQAKPDGNFPTVSSPNPENPEALKLAVKLLKKIRADIAIGSDPDADRIGVAVFHKNDIHYLTGNQIGSLMLNYIASNLKARNQMPSKPYFVKTIVTTPLQDKLAAHYGVRVENTLTGFKWMCGRMRELEENNPEQTFLFATEESFGYLNHNYVRDKDGIAPSVLIAEMALWYKIKGMTLIDGLNEIYQQFGFYHEGLLNMVYKGMEGAQKIVRIMDNFRKAPPVAMIDDRIVQIDDLSTGQSKNLVSGDINPIKLPKSNVLGFYFDSGNRLFVRPSGTEPKIKFYTMIHEDVGRLNEKKKKALDKTEALIEYLRGECERA